MLGLLFLRKYGKEAYPIDTLFHDLSRRVSHLEDQVRYLRASHQHLTHLYTLLQMGEHFRQLHKHLRRIKDDKTVKHLLKGNEFTKNDVKLIRRLGKERNGVAHPGGVPDLTDEREEVVKVFVKVERLLKQLK